MGDLGEWAYRFVDLLVETDQTLWQMLPLGPTSYGDSPYQSLSTFAGNPLLINPESLAAQGWLSAADLADVPPFPEHSVNYGWVIPYRFGLLDKAYAGFRTRAVPAQREAFESWCAENAGWLDDFALFVALKDAHGGHEWTKWEKPLALREPAALAAARTTHAAAVEGQKFRQWVFHTQWFQLKAYANSRGVQLVGDIPIFVAHDSSDVWSARELFHLDADGMPTVVAGVPPDYFSPTGQRWGNPLYRWDVLKAEGYAWWIQRFQAVLNTVDLVRIDHFRGFEAYWEIPAIEPTAVKGIWQPGPRYDFFDVVREALGELPIVAEDLGVITQEVESLRDTYNLPGMKVLQFAWSEPKNPFLPHNHSTNCIVYTGTHDNNTTIGWWQAEVADDTRRFIQDYLGREVWEANWDLIRLGMMSAAHTFIAPMQDILSLDKAGRMNTPGVEAGNWTWRFTAEALDHPAKDRLAHLTWLYRRRPDQQEKIYGDVAVQS